MPKERKLVAAVIYNRLHDGMPLQIDATIRFATGNFTKPLSQSELQLDSPYNTYTNSGLPPGPIGNPASPRSRRRPIPAHVSYLYYVVKPNTCGRAHVRHHHGRVRAGQGRLRPGARGERGQRADARALPGLMRTAARRPRPADLALALARDAHRRAGRARARRASGPTRRSRSRPRTSRRASATMPAEGFVGANVTVPHKVAALELAGDASAGGPGDRRRQHAQLRRRADRSREHRRQRASWTRSPEPPAGRRALVLGAGGSARAVVWALVTARRRGSDLEPHARARRAPGRGARRRDRSSIGELATGRLSTIDLIVNATTVGMGDAARERCRPQEPAARCRFVGRDTPIGGPRLRAGRDGARQARRERAAQRSSTGSRCWFARGPRRFGSGPGWNPRSRR